MKRFELLEVVEGDHPDAWAMGVRDTQTGKTFLLSNVHFSFLEQGILLFWGATGDMGQEYRVIFRNRLYTPAIRNRELLALYREVCLVNGYQTNGAGGFVTDPR